MLHHHIQTAAAAEKKSTKEYRQRLGEPAEMDPVDWNWGTAMEMYIDLYV